MFLSLSSLRIINDPGGVIADHAGHGLQSLAVSKRLQSWSSTALDCLRNRFLVASRPVLDLLLSAKHLFVGARPFES